MADKKSPSPSPPPKPSPPPAPKPGRTGDSAPPRTYKEHGNTVNDLVPPPKRK